MSFVDFAIYGKQEVEAMSGQAKSSELKFWLHVPLQTTGGDWPTPPAGGRLTILGHPCRLCVQDLPQIPQGMTGSLIVVRQYLLFDPLPETEARKLLDELILRMPVLAFQQQASYEIPNAAWIKKQEDHGVDI